MLEAKLARYIKHCYPPGNVSEKHAKPSELSYLMYYLQTHRYRIPQATKIIKEKLQRQAHRQNKLGNAVVSLEIAKELVTSCASDLNVFAVDILEIANATLLHAETGISVAANELIAEFYTEHDGLLFTTSGYTTMFQKVVDATCHGVQNDGTREASLNALHALTKMPCITSDAGLVAVSSATKALYGYLDGTPLDASNTGVKALRNLFASDQVVLSTTTRAVLASSSPQSHQWTLTLFDKAAHWAQVQLRFTMPKTVVQSIKNNVEPFSDYLLIMLRSPVSMVGLDVRATLSALLKLQHDHQHEKLRSCISALASHQVYPGQANDMLQEILAGYQSKQETEVDESAVVSDLMNVEAILSSGVERLSLSPWLGTQWLLTSKSDQVVVAYVCAFQAFVREAGENPKVASQLARSLCQLYSETAPVVLISAYYCLEALVLSLKGNSIILVPSIQRLQSEGFAENDLYRSTAAVSCAQALFLTTARASGKKHAEEVYFNTIHKRVEQEAWFRGILSPSAGFKISKAVRSARHSPPAVSASSDLACDVADLQLTPQEQALASSLDTPMISASNSLDNFKVRARSLADSVTTGDQRILSSRLGPATRVEAPTVKQLRARTVTGSSTASTARKASGSVVFQPGAELMSLLQQVEIDNRGRLAV